MKRLSTRLLVLASAIVAVIALTSLASLTVKLEPHGVDPLLRSAYKQRIAEVRSREAVMARTDLPLPRVSLEKNHFDFGMIDPESSSSHDFPIENVGSGPLSLRVASTSCKCTIGKVGSPVLLPGEKTYVRMEWNAGQAAERYEQTAKILTNDPAFPELKISVGGTVKTVLGYHPHQFFFGSIDAGESTERSIYLYSQLWDDFVVSSVTEDGLPVPYELTPLSSTELPANLHHYQPRSFAKLSIQFRPKNQGRFEGDFEIELLGSDGTTRKETIHYTGKTRSPIIFFSPELVAGEGIDLGVVECGDLIEKQIIVRVRSKNPPPIEVTDIQPQELEATLEPISSDEYRLTLRVPKDCKPTVFNRDSHRGYIELGSPDDPSITNWMPVWGAVVKAESN